MKHPHAELIRQFYNELMEDQHAHNNWQFTGPAGVQWSDCLVSPAFAPDSNYRRKPKTIRIGEFDVPEPLRVPPEVGTTYYVPSLVDRFIPYVWDDDGIDEDYLTKGLVHSTQKAAELHGLALLSFTKHKD